MKKKDIIISLLLIVLFLFMILNMVNYDMHEFKLSMKSIARQQLTLEEMKSTNIYKAYNQIEYDTSLEQITGLMKKKSRSKISGYKSWNYPHGHLSVFFRGEENTEIFLKAVTFRTPYAVELTLDKVHSLFECDSIEEVSGILGESAMLSRSYDKDGKVTDYGYEWGIKTGLSKKFIEDTEKTYGKKVSFPMRYDHPFNLFKDAEKKYIFRVLVDANGAIHSFSLDDYKK